MHSQVQWMPFALIDGDDRVEGQQTFFQIDDVFCRAVYLPSRRNLYFTAERTFGFTSDQIRIIETGFRRDGLDITMVQREKTLVLKKENITQYDDSELRLLMAFYRTLGDLMGKTEQEIRERFRL